MVMEIDRSVRSEDPDTTENDNSVRSEFPTQLKFDQARHIHKPADMIRSSDVCVRNDLPTQLKFRQVLRPDGFTGR